MAAAMVMLWGIHIARHFANIEVRRILKNSGLTLNLYISQVFEPSLSQLKSLYYVYVLYNCVRMYYASREAIYEAILISLFKRQLDIFIFSM